MFSSVNNNCSWWFRPNPLRYRKPTKNNGRWSSGPFINLCSPAFSKWKVFHPPTETPWRNILHIQCTKIFERTVPREIVSSKWCRLGLSDCLHQPRDIFDKQQVSIVVTNGWIPNVYRMIDTVHQRKIFCREKTPLMLKRHATLNLKQKTVIYIQAATLPLCFGFQRF